MTTINPAATGVALPLASQPTLAAPKPALPQPAQVTVKPNIVDRFQTPHRSQDLANTQAHQIDSIRQGIQNGSITAAEAGRLLDQQAQVSQATASASADGVITAREAAGIRRLQRQAGVDVFKATHNSDRGAPLDRAVTRGQSAQLDRIAQGVRSGSLTGTEADTLLKDQADISRTVGESQADGQLDFIEKQMLGIRQDAASHEIGLLKSNSDKAPHASRLNFPVAL